MDIDSKYFLFLMMLIELRKTFKHSPFSEWFLFLVGIFFQMKISPIQEQIHAEIPE